MRYLIINADDFGISEGVNCGIIEAWNAGSITSTSIMPTGAAFGDAISNAKANPGLPIGVHFSTSSGTCCARPGEIGTLADPTGVFLVREVDSFEQQMGIATRISPIELELELRAQFEAVRSAGLRPQHVDCHHAHLYAVPRLFSVVLRLASEWKIAARFPFGDNIDQHLSEMARMYSVSQDVISSLAKLARDAKATFKTITPDRYFQVQSRWNMDTKKSFLHNMIDSLPEGVSELCFHPGRGCAEREDDLALITAPEFASKLEANEIVIHNPLVGW